ncbi:MAG: hypothetical protein AB2L11_08130 [Syntrophobacteraceae bacterium]
MKRLIVLSLVAVMISVAGLAQAEQKCPLGNGNVAFKIDYLRFTDSKIADRNAENAIYFGGEAYVPVMGSNFYLGIESGYAFSSGDESYTYYDGSDEYGDYYIKQQYDYDIDYVPIELNAKYVVAINPCWAMDIGAGLSYNYLKLHGKFKGTYYVVPYEGPRENLESGSDSADLVDDWLFGGQFFYDVNYTSGQWFLGANVKYQLTESKGLKYFGEKINADNLRVGLQAGFMF